MTLRSLERGGSGVTIGAYLGIMQVLGIEKDLDQLAAADPLGRELQDARLSTRIRSMPTTSTPTRSTPTTVTPTRSARSSVASAGAHSAEVKRWGSNVAPDLRSGIEKMSPAKSSGDWIDEGGFASADALADMITQASTIDRRKR